MISVCIIDDDKMDRFILERALKAHLPEPCTFSHADNEESGYALVVETAPDIVIIDVNLVGSCGLNLKDRLLSKLESRSTHSNMTIVNVTGFVRLTSAGDQLDSLSQEILSKPMRLSEYSDFVKAVLAQRAVCPA